MKADQHMSTPPTPPTVEQQLAFFKNAALSLAATYASIEKVAQEPDKWNNGSTDLREHLKFSREYVLLPEAVALLESPSIKAMIETAEKEDNVDVAYQALVDRYGREEAMRILRETLEDIDG